MATHRIGILLTDLREGNTAALRYLILHLNRLQSSFEFELLAAPDLPFMRELNAHSFDDGSELERSFVHEKSEEFVQAFIQFLVAEKEKYQLSEGPPQHFIVITLARYRDGYYSARKGQLSVIALGAWKKHMAPPSILEFILTLILREAVAAVSSAFEGSQHYGTKGCLFDFTPSLEDAKHKVLSAFICSHCAKKLESDGKQELIWRIPYVLEKRWLGRIDEPGTPAFITAKLGYNLFVSKGLSPTWREKLVSILREEGAKEAVKLIGAVLVALLLVLMGLKATEKEPVGKEPIPMMVRPAE